MADIDPMQKPKGKDLLRGIGILFFQRGGHILNALIFALIVPRMMRPGEFGKYVLITSVALWFAILSELGTTQMMGKFVPEFSSRGDVSGLRKLASNVLALRITNGFIWE